MKLSNDLDEDDGIVGKHDRMLGSSETGEFFDVVGARKTQHGV